VLIRGYSDGGAIPYRFFLILIASLATRMASSSTIPMRAMRGGSRRRLISSFTAGATASWS